MFLDLTDSSSSAPAAWTAEEQQLLEQALKTYPSNTEERWEKIAACIPGRDKKECIRRYKVDTFLLYLILFDMNFVTIITNFVYFVFLSPLLTVFFFKKLTFTKKFLFVIMRFICFCLLIIKC